VRSALSIPNDLAKQVRFCMSGTYGVRKEQNCVPHDVGDPGMISDSLRNFLLLRNFLNILMNAAQITIANGCGVLMQLFTS
jgi:hypothetical protein